MTKEKKTKTDKFEQSLEKLEELVGQLESGNLGLDESLDSFEKGIKYYKECKDLLAKAEKKIKTLTENLREEDFNE